MFDTHERIFQKLAESGHKEFSSEMIKGIIDEVESEEVDKIYEEWRRETEPYATRDAEPEPVSWEDATEDLGDFPELEDNHDREMELES
jgi:hypothetical protein